MEAFVASFDSVLCFCVRNRLPLHVAGIVGAAALQGNDVIDDVAGTRA